MSGRNAKSHYTWQDEKVLQLPTSHTSAKLWLEDSPAYLSAVVAELESRMGADADQNWRVDANSRSLEALLQTD
jgi:hypothetical protein